MTMLQGQGILGEISFLDKFTNISIMIAGTMVLLWLGELISEKGIGNGVSLIIFGGIVAGLPSIIQRTLFTFDPSQIPMYGLFLAVAVLIIGGVVIISEAERLVPVSYAKQVRGSRMYGGVSTYLPLKVNQAGVIPIIFAISILLFPQMIGNFMQMSANDTMRNIGISLASFFQAGGFMYGALYFLLVVIFTYFYTAVTFDTKQIAENVQKQGGFIPGIRPGNSTAEFLHRVMNRITLAGALSLGLIAILPFIIQYFTGMTTLTIGGTALLIVVSVALDTMKQIKAQLVMHEYERF